jgi:dihydroflavonol-4-reductase
MDLAGARIAVTGATGFLGRYVVEVLLGRGAHVVGAVRSPDRVPALVARGVEMRRADLGNPVELEGAFRGMDAIVSNAALFSLSNRRWQDHAQTNVDGTRNVLTAAALAGVKRVIHVSSVAVYRDGGARVREDAAQHDERSAKLPWTVYSISKALSEQLAWKLAAELGIELTAVRPCIIYGAHDPNFTPLLRWLVWPPLTIVPAFAGMPFVYAGDVAEAIARCLERPTSIGKAYNVTGDDASIWQLVEAWREAGGSVPWVRLPLPLPVTRGFDHALATRELGWQNRPLVEGLRETMALDRAS